jgi:hypothetical protein
MWLFQILGRKGRTGATAASQFDTTSTILVVDGIAVENAKVGVKFHTGTTSGVPSIMVEGVLFNSTMTLKNN